MCIGWELWILTLRAAPVQMNLGSGAEGHVFGWSHGQKICQHPLLPFKTTSQAVAFNFLHWLWVGPESTPSKEPQEHGVTDVSSWGGI